MRGALPSLVGLLFILLAGPATAAMVGDASVPFRAERTVTVDGRSYTGPLFHTPGHERNEQSLLGMREVFLLDTAAARGELVVPALQTYVAFPFPPMLAALGAPDLLRRPLGAEDIAGIRTEKYRIDETAADGSRARGALWLSRDGILMKLAVSITRAHGGRPIEIGMVLSQVERGPQDPALFRLPSGYTQLPAEALGPLIGARRN